MANTKKRTLLERYEIPINHLDFKYIETCSNASEMEKIVQILRSGEEGHYPDLTKCAENKLHELKPNSKLFRYEEQVRERSALPAEEWKHIYNWNHSIKNVDQQFKELGKTSADNKFELDVAPIRKGGKIITNATKSATNNNCNNKTTKTEERIKSTDYNKWDKFDADEEILRMDLKEEREQEEIERKNRINQQRSQRDTLKITDITEAENKKQVLIESLTALEREKLAEEYRLRGNEYFRIKEYETAIEEYTRALNIFSNAAAYNNRAISNIRLQLYAAAIDDCKNCLQLEPNNLKARLRLAQANYEYGNRRESYDYFLHVLQLEPKNDIALKAINELRQQLPDLPPPADTTRLKIQEFQTAKAGVAKMPASNFNTTKVCTNVTNDVNSNQKQQQKKEQLLVKQQANNNKNAADVSKCKDYDLAQLIIPDKIVKNKLASAAEAFGNMIQNKSTNSKHSKALEDSTNTGKDELRLPMHAVKSLQKNKILIEEI